MKNDEQTTESQYKVTDWHSGVLTCRMMMRQNDPHPQREFKNGWPIGHINSDDHNHRWRWRQWLGLWLWWRAGRRKWLHSHVHPKCVKVGWTTLASSSLMIWRDVEGHTFKNPTLHSVYMWQVTFLYLQSTRLKHIMYCTISRQLQNMQSVANWTD